MAVKPGPDTGATASNVEVKVKEGDPKLSL